MNNYLVEWKIERNAKPFGTDGRYIEADTEEEAIEAVKDMLIDESSYVYDKNDRHLGELLFQDYQNTDRFHSFTATKVSAK